MRAWIPGLLIAAGAAVFLVWGSLAEPDSGPRVDTRRANVLASGIVASVTDGDTIRLADNRRIRLVQIDAPERPEGECYAEQAAAELERLAPVGSELRLTLDGALDPKDEHGRFLVYARNQRGNINLRLVETGAAAPYFGGQRGRLAGALMTAARRAKATRRGLWGACPATRLDPDRRLDSRR